MIVAGSANPSLAAAASAERRETLNSASRALLVAAPTLVAAMYATQAFAIITASRSWLVQRLPDDAYYYLQIGTEIAHGHGATFDGIHQTNGFHPLWQLLIAGAAMIMSGDALVKAVLLMALLFSAGGALLWGWSVARLLGAPAAALGFLLALVVVPGGGSRVDGMEGALTVASLGMLTIMLIRFDERRRSIDAIIVGLTCGLGVLSRLDLVVVLWVLGPVLFLRTRSLRLTVTWAAAFLLTVAPYFAWNELTFGALLSVSGTIKLESMRAIIQGFGGYLSVRYVAFIGQVLWSYVLVILRLDSGGILQPLFTITDVLFVLLAIFGIRFGVHRFAELRRGRREIPAAAVAISAVALVLVLKAAVELVELPLWAGSWYSAPQRLVFALGVGALAWVGLTRLPRQWLVPLGALCVTLAALSVGLDGEVLLSSASTVPTPTSWQDANLEAADWIVSQGPAGVYGSTDSGLIGFYAAPRATVVNLDGLVNDYAYARRLLARDSPISLYRREHVRFLVERRAAGTASVPGCAVQLWSSSEPVFYAPDTMGPTGGLRVGVWDLLPCG